MNIIHIQCFLRNAKIDELLTKMYCRYQQLKHIEDIMRMTKF